MATKKRASRARTSKIQNSKGPELPKKIRIEPHNLKNPTPFENGIIQNGLGNMLGFNNQVPFGAQLSQVDTLFKNERWYLLSNMRQLLSEMYVEHGLIQAVVDVPVDDGLQDGVDIKTKQLDEDQIEQLQVSLDRDNDIATVGQALKWNRLFGGAGILIVQDQDPELPFSIDAINKDSLIAFRDVDMWELYGDRQNTEGYDADLNLIENDYYIYYSNRIHSSRVMKMTGLKAPSFIRPRLRGWGFSIIEAVVRSINQYLKSNDLSFEVLDEFKLDVFKIKNLTNYLLTPEGEELIRRRVAIANQQKNYQNALVMDAEDDYTNKQLSFTGLAEVMEGIRTQLASDLRIPQTKLFGDSAKGFGGGEDSMENYNAMVESQVRSKCKYDILRVIEIKCKKLFDFVPSDLSISFKPMRKLSATDEETVKTSKFNRIFQTRTAGEMSPLEFREQCNHADLFPTPLATEGISDELTPQQAEDGATDEGDGGKPGDQNTGKPKPQETEKTRIGDT